MTAMAEATLPDLIATGFVKAPLELERTYKGVRLTASVQPDGTVLCGGETCETLSAAGGVARKSVLATPPSDPPPATNGWTFWHFRDPKSGNLRDMGTQPTAGVSGPEEVTWMVSSERPPAETEGHRSGPFYWAGRPSAARPATATSVA